MQISISEKDLKIAELLTKTYFFFYFRDRALKGDIETNKGDKYSICARVKHASKNVLKAGINLSCLWTINYGLLWLYTYIHERFSLFDTSTNVLTGFMISLFLAAPALRVRRAWNLMGKSVWNRIRFFLLLGIKYYFIEKLSLLINNLLERFFKLQK